MLLASALSLASQIALARSSAVLPLTLAQGSVAAVGGYISQHCTLCSPKIDGRRLTAITRAIAAFAHRAFGAGVGRCIAVETRAPHSHNQSGYHMLLRSRLANGLVGIPLQSRQLTCHRGDGETCIIWDCCMPLLTNAGALANAGHSRSVKKFIIRAAIQAVSVMQATEAAVKSAISPASHIGVTQVLLLLSKTCPAVQVIAVTQASLASILI